MREPIRSLVISLPAPDEHVERLRRAFPEIEITRAQPDQLVEALETADAVAGWSIPEEAIARATRLKWIHRGAAGVEDLLTAAINDAVRRVESTTQEKMAGLTMGMPMPPGFKLPF